VKCVLESASVEIKMTAHKCRHFQPRSN